LIVCVCNAINDEKVQSLIDDWQPLTFNEFAAKLFVTGENIANVCGGCQLHIEGMINDYQSRKG